MEKEKSMKSLAELSEIARSINEDILKQVGTNAEATTVAQIVLENFIAMNIITYIVKIGKAPVALGPPIGTGPEIGKGFQRGRKDKFGQNII